MNKLNWEEEFDKKFKFEIKDTKEVFKQFIKVELEKQKEKHAQEIIDTARRIEEIHKEELENMIEEEIIYWKNVFDNRPKDRDLESDTVAQKFARIEIERWEDKAKQVIK